jgi:hypothetical protein
MKETQAVIGLDIGTTSTIPDASDHRFQNVLRILLGPCRLWLY